MRPISQTEVNAIMRLHRKGLVPKQIAHRVGRSSGAVSRVIRGACKGKSLKVSPIDRIDIHAWWKATRSLPTMAEMARRYKVTNQYIRDICYQMDRAEGLDLRRSAAEAIRSAN